MEKKLGIRINLGKPRHITVDIFFRWLIKTGRVIVVVTELVALVALLYRFILDRQIIDLHDQIRQEREFLKVRSKEEGGYRKIQAKLSSIETLPKDSFNQIEQIKFLIDVMKSTRDLGLTDTHFTIGRNSLSVGGRSPSVFILNSYLDYLKHLDQVLAIILDEVANQQGSIRFRISVELNSAGGQR